jgi:hypothetical protein
VAATLYGDPDKALALLGDPKNLPDGVGAAALAPIRSFLSAQSPRNAAERARAAGELLASARRGELYPEMAMAMLSRLGDMDGAFDAAALYADRDDHSFDSPAYLFMPATAPMRRDPRFMPLAARLGLPQYWLESGEWPDFCSEPGLPYDCKAEAAKVVAAKH